MLRIMRFSRDSFLYLTILFYNPQKFAYNENDKGGAAILDCVIMKKKNKLKIILIAFLTVIILLLGSIVFYHESLKGTGSQDEVVTITVEDGMSLNALLDELKANDLIKNILVAKLYIRFNSLDTLKANTYSLNKAMGTEEILRIVTEGDFDYLEKTNLLVQEGVTVPEVANRVAEVTGTSQEEVLAKWSDTEYLNELIGTYWFLDESILQDGIKYPLEGYLYPETYIISSTNPTIEECTKMMLDMTDQHLSQYKQNIDEMNWSVHEFLTMASIIEREGQNEVDYPKIAGVFMNRLNSGMRLQSDITVLYALGRTGVDVSYADLQTDSPYNTYLYEGLPIGPISNVSEPIMNALVNYEHNDYYYFYATPDGEVLYASTLAEHEQNVQAHPWPSE